MSQNERGGALFVLLSVTGYALLPVWVKTVQAAGLNSLDIATWRFGLAVPIFWLLVRVLNRGTPASANQLPRARLLALGTLFAIAGVAAFWGFERLPVGTFIVLFYTYPAMVAIMSAVLGERLPVTGWVALFLTTLGVVFTVPDFTAGLGSESIQGVLLALFNAFVVAVYFIISSRLLKGQVALAEGSAWSISGAFIVLLLFVPIRAVQVPVGGPAENIIKIVLALPLAAAQSPEPAKIILFMLALAAFSTVLPVFFLTKGIQKVGATRASILGTVEPILTSLFAFLLLGENMKGTELAGGGLILLSVIILQFGGQNRKTRMETTPVVS